MLFAVIAPGKMLPPPKYFLEWRPVVGESHKYQVVVGFSFGGDTMQISTKLRLIVTAVRSDGSYDVRSQSLGGEATSGETRHSLPADAPQTQSFYKGGRQKNVPKPDPDPDPFSDLFRDLITFEAPAHGVGTGESWTSAARPGGQVFRYQLRDVRAEGSDPTAAITFQGSGLPVAGMATGSVLLSLRNGFLRQLQVTVPHFRPQGATSEADVQISMDEVRDSRKP